MTMSGYSLVSEQAAERGRKVRRVTIGSVLANIGLTVVKFLFGLGFHSKVLLADAAHSLSDLISDFGLLYSERLWSRPCDAEHPYGHGKIENVAGLGIGLLLFGAAGGIIWDAVRGFLHPQPNTDTWLTFTVAILSIAVKEWLFRWTADVAKEVRSEAVLANAWHHRSDALSSVVAAVSIILSLFWEQLWFVDEVGAVMIAAILVRAAGQICYSSLNRLIDQAPPEKLCAEIIKCAHEVAGVITVHAMRTRYVGAEVFIDLHIEVKPDITVRDGHAIAHNVSDKLIDCFDEVADVVVHVEPYLPDKRQGAIHPRPA